MSIPPSELAARQLLARIGKKLRKMVHVVPDKHRGEMSAMADSIREELAKPRLRDPALRPGEGLTECDMHDDESC